MRYVNNWITRLIAGLDSDGNVLPVDPVMLDRLDLSGGEQYTLTLVSTLDPLQQNVVEVVTISASGGGHILTRGREGTSAQNWPFDTYVYAGVTAGILEHLENPSAGVDSFNGRNGDVVLTGGDVSAALGYSPADPASLAPVATSGDYADLSGKPFIPASPGDIGAATAAQGAKADTAVQPAALGAGLDTKVDKLAGYGLSQENYTTAEKAKLAGLESSHFKGLHGSLAALQAAHPTAVAGDYADVDAGAGVDVVRYLWDVSDAQWVAQAASGSSMTPAQIKTAYESNADTNAFTDAQESKLAGIAAGATANPDTGSLAEGSNLYFTAARVLATVLSGLSLATGGAIVSTDSVLAAFGKIQRQLNDHFGAGGTAHSVATAALAGFMSASDKSKLDGVATGATANSSDATLLSRANHTGTQAASTISDFAEATDDRVAALLVAGANVTLTYNDAANTLTIASSGGGGGGLTNLTEAKNTSTPNATAPVVALSVAITETNGDLALVAKGSGALLAQIPDGTTTGGNKRGTEAVDLQRVRTNAARVASGIRSFIGSGRDNSAAGSYAGSVCGEGNPVTADYAFNGGGYFNTLSAQYAFNGGGRNNTVNATDAANLGGYNNGVTGQWAANLGGRDNNVSGLASVGCGWSAKTLNDYSFNFASGIFAAVGDAQDIRMVLRRQTTTSTQSALTADGAAQAAGNQLTLENNSAMTVTGKVTARQNSTGDTASWVFSVCIKRGANAAATAIVGSATVTAVAADSGASTWGLALSADTTRGALSVLFTGEASKTIRAICTIESAYVQG